MGKTSAKSKFIPNNLDAWVTKTQHMLDTLSSEPDAASNHFNDSIRARLHIADRLGVATPMGTCVDSDYNYSVSAIALFGLLCRWAFHEPHKNSNWYNDRVTVMSRSRLLLQALIKKFVTSSCTINAPTATDDCITLVITVDADGVYVNWETVLFCSPAAPLERAGVRFTDDRAVPLHWALQKVVVEENIRSTSPARRYSALQAIAGLTSGINR
jgi:hypothetical protein